MRLNLKTTKNARKASNLVEANGLSHEEYDDLPAQEDGTEHDGG